MRTAIPIELTEEECLRFFKYIGDEDSNGCIPFTGGKSKNGYGAFTSMKYGKNYKAHRVAMWLHGIDLKDDLVIDHICRNRSCINPDHLRLVDSKTNLTENSISPLAKNFSKKQCKRGHDFIEGSFYIVKTKYGKGRMCKACQKILRRKYYVRGRMEYFLTNGTKLRFNKRKNSSENL